jgi:DNA repair protein RadC
MNDHETKSNSESSPSAYSPGEAKPKRAKKEPAEFKIVALKECPTPERLQMCDTPEKAHEYFELHIRTDERFRPDCECFIALFLNTRRRIKGHYLVTIGTLDTLLVHPREVFRAAIISASAAVVLMHNHPSGDPTPSEADIKVTRDLIRAGQLLKIEVLDHIIVGHQSKVSLRELGYFYR